MSRNFSCYIILLLLIRDRHDAFHQFLYENIVNITFTSMLTLYSHNITSYNFNILYISSSILFKILSIFTIITIALKNLQVEVKK